MPGPVSTLGSPLNVNSGGATGGAQSADPIVNDLGTVTDQVNNQTQQFGGLLNDPNFTQNSQMASMLKLQQAMAQQQMMYQAVSNMMKGNTDSAKNAIANFK